ncbi:hypothetical protein CSB11_01065 [Candidatus Campbellbacteria bacterium]|nr:MAG: hypothetical protein CSB11_01065 [Candidatus Campbellbacteria bacterium]
MNEGFKKYVQKEKEVLKEVQSKQENATSDETSKETQKQISEDLSQQEKDTQSLEEFLEKDLEENDNRVTPERFAEISFEEQTKKSLDIFENQIEENDNLINSEINLKIQDLENELQSLPDDQKQEHIESLKQEISEMFDQKINLYSRKSNEALDLIAQNYEPTNEDALEDQNFYQNSFEAKKQAYIESQTKQQETIIQNLDSLLIPDKKDQADSLGEGVLDAKDFPPTPKPIDLNYVSQKALEKFQNEMDVYLKADISKIGEDGKKEISKIYQKLKNGTFEDKKQEQDAQNLIQEIEKNFDFAKKSQDIPENCKSLNLKNNIENQEDNTDSTNNQNQPFPEEGFKKSFKNTFSGMAKSAEKDLEVFKEVFDTHDKILQETVQKIEGFVNDENGTILDKMKRMPQKSLYLAGAASGGMAGFGLKSLTTLGKTVTLPLKHPLKTAGIGAAGYFGFKALKFIFIKSMPYYLFWKFVVKPELKENGAWETFKKFGRVKKEHWWL